jgi:hypothetical protein
MPWPSSTNSNIERQTLRLTLSTIDKRNGQLASTGASITTPALATLGGLCDDFGFRPLS